MDNLFSTHPNTENRIAELEAMARETGQTMGPSEAGALPRDDGPWSRQAPPSRDASGGPWG
jgi:heat shock protein HtpX